MSIPTPMCTSLSQSVEIEWEEGVKVVACDLSVTGCQETHSKKESGLGYLSCNHNDNVLPGK